MINKANNLPEATCPSCGSSVKATKPVRFIPKLHMPVKPVRSILFLGFFFFAGIGYFVMYAPYFQEYAQQDRLSSLIIPGLIPLVIGAVILVARIASVKGAQYKCPHCGLQWFARLEPQTTDTTREDYP